MARGHNKGWQLNLRININHSVQLLSSDSFPHHGLQYARLPCRSPTPGACSNSIELVMPSNHLILCHPLLLLSIFPSIRVFSNESVLPFRWPKYWSISLSSSPANEYSWLISFRIWSLCSPKDSQKYSPRQFKSIHSLSLSFLYGPALTSIRDYWKKQSFDFVS